MFSGGDSSDGINSLNQLGAYGFVNQVAVSNAMAGGQNIDWAQLAQQWIQMRDNSELETKTDVVSSSNKVADNGFKFEEKGEADMDMDDEEQSDDKTQNMNNDLETSSATNSINQSWFFGESSSKIEPRSTSDSHWQNRETLHTQNAKNNQPTNPTAHIPSLLKITIPHPNEIRIMPDVNNQSNSSMMDAAKRKGLPAWIREGLEKMEREKQKQLERDQQNRDINSSDEDDIPNKNLVVKSNSLNIAPTTILEEESTDNEETVKIKEYLKKDDEEDEVYNSSENKTYEQKLTELMTVVRRTLTELLLEATNEEISKVADETFKIFKSKASSVQVVHKSALSTLTGKLGLAVYGDSSSENESDNNESNSSNKPSCQSESSNDSEEEIRNAIRLKRRSFIKTSEEIEERVASAAVREEEKLKYFLRKEEENKLSREKHERSLAKGPSIPSHTGHNNFKGYEKDFGEITETKIQHLNGKRQKERTNRRERITRFSDNKDKFVALPNAANFLTNLNSNTNFGISNNTTAVPTINQRKNIPDINGLLPNYTNTGMTSVLNAADAALEKVLKSKTVSNSEKQSRRHDNYNQSKKRRISESKNSRSRSKSSTSSTSSSSSFTSDSDSSTSSRSSQHSKYKRRSAKKHKSHKRVERNFEKSRKDHRSERKYSSTSYKKRDRESTRSRNYRNASSDSEDEYRRRHRNEPNYASSSSQARSYSSSRRDRDHEHSRSQSRSCSSNPRQ